LPRLADEYILGSNPLIRAVVGIDLDYRRLLVPQDRDQVFLTFAIPFTATKIEKKAVVVYIVLGFTITSA